MSKIPEHQITHVYATGDSFGFGQGLKGHDVNDFYKFTPELRKTVFSALIADKLGADYTNTAMPGCSNDRLIRKIMTDIPVLLETVPAENIFVIVNITHAARREFYCNETKSYLPYINNAPPNDIVRSYRDMWKTYTLHFDNVIENVDRYLMQIVSMQLFLKSLGVKYILTRSMYETSSFQKVYAQKTSGLATLINHTTFPTDLRPFNDWVQVNGYKITPCKHADEAGHAGWADHLLDYLIDKNFLQETK